MQKLLVDLKSDFQKLYDEVTPVIRKSRGALNACKAAVLSLPNNWAGVWGDASYNLYIFETELTTCTAADIGRLIQNATTIDLVAIQRALTPVYFKSREFNGKLITDLSWINNRPNLDQECELLKSAIEETFGLTTDWYIQNSRSSHKVEFENVEHLDAMPTPPHIWVIAHFKAMMSRVDKCERYLEHARRLLRQVEVKTGLSESTTKSDLIDTLLDNFHSVVKTLKNRHAGRPTLTVNDEYDVQDLLFALLRVHYKDIRREEYTPSYAGGASRVDFLLKEERTVIEIKKTRSTLKDKDLGAELLIDVARYQSHPDCSTLYFFVYDPEDLLDNPIGIQTDIEKKSTSDLEIRVFIKP